jgi:sulfite exporter TauE/SafE/copper chaperone CopZ
MKTIRVPIKGMHCSSCEILVGENIRKIPGVDVVKVNQRHAEAIIEYSHNEPSNKAIKRAVEEAGYQVGEKENLPWVSSNPKDYKDLLKAAIILYFVYLVASWLNLFNLDVGAQKTGILIALLVGLIAGVSTCMALVGGLVLSLSARHAELHPEATTTQKFRPHIYFNIGRILGYAILGGLIGLIGSAFSPSNNLLGFLTMVVGGVMIFFGLKLVEIFPVLKDKSITLPSWVAKIFGLHKEVKEYSPKSSMVMGALTFFLPCGFTQAMQLYAVSTGSFWQGMAIMGLFALGTAPGLLGIGGLTSVFKGHKARTFFMTAGLAVIMLGWTNILNGSRLFGGSSSSANAAVSAGAVQEVRMTQTGSGYKPNILTVEKGRRVRWIIDSQSSFTCAASLVMPKFGISKILKSGQNIIEFTPTEVGEIPFSCSMGMYRGKFVVVDKKGASLNGVGNDNVQIANAGGSCGSSGGGCGCGGGARKPLETKTGSAATVSNEQVIRSTYTLNDDLVPNSFTVKKGQKVKFIVDVKEDGQGCMSTIVIPGLYDQIYRLVAGQSIVMEFTPDKIGDYPITCAMGIPRGQIKVVV